MQKTDALKATALFFNLTLGLSYDASTASVITSFNPAHTLSIKIS